MSKQTVENCLVLDVLALAHDGLLLEGSTFRMIWKEGAATIASLEAHVEDECLFLEHVEAANVENDRPFPIELIYTATAIGARRVWFCCPMCLREVRKLYLPPGGYRFHCRTCHQLSYASRNKRRSAAAWPPQAWRKLSGEFLRPDRAALHAPSPAQIKSLREGARLLSQLLGEPERPAPPKRPRGRPKQKRPYRRTKPFLGTPRGSEALGLCLRCRDWRELADPRAVVLPNGRSARQGTCPLCGAKISVIVKDEHPAS